MKHLDEIKNIDAAFDIRVETLAVNLLEQAKEINEDVSMDQLMISPKGHLKRKSSHDVSEVRKKYFDHDTVLQVFVNREGFFDTLPQRLFLKTDDEIKDPKKRSKRINEQIKLARKFFLPYDQAHYHTRIEIEQLEQRYSEEFPAFMETLWGLQQFKEVLDHRQVFLLCHLLPEAYRAVGDWELTGMFFEALIQKPINFGFSAPKTLEIPNSGYPMNELSLGLDTFMGDRSRDDFPTLEITIKGITSDELEDFLPGKKSRIILENLLCGYFIPIDVPYVINLDVTSDSLGFDLGQKILGYDTMLN